MVEVKNTTQKGKQIISECKSYGIGDIFNAYNRPSPRKIRAYQEIEARANNTAGYNYNLHVIGANCHNFSTGYTYQDENGNHYAVKDTQTNTYIVLIPN